MKSKKIKIPVKCAHSWKTVGLIYVQNQSVTMLKSYERVCSVCGKRETVKCADEIAVSLV